MEEIILTHPSLINHQRVLYLIRTKGPISRAEIARLTHLTKASSSKIVDLLERRRLISPMGLGQPARGRPSLLYQFNSASAIAIGVEILDDEIQAVVTQMDAQPQRSYSFPLPDPSPETVLGIIKTIVITVQKDFPNPILGIGIGLPGICDAQQKVVIFSERLNWKNIPLGKMIQESIGVEIYIENRANAAALGELWYGLGRDSDNFVYIQISLGIKAGIILGGSLYLGSNGSAGEIGHMTVVRDGPSCVCGKRGCLEALASTQAILERVNALVKAGKGESLLQLVNESKYPLHLDDLIAAAQQGDPLVLEVLSEAARHLGMALSHLATMFNPDKIILGPFASQVPSIYLEMIHKTVAELTFDMSLRGLKIVNTELGQPAVAIGAAALMIAKDLQSLQDQII